MHCCAKWKPPSAPGSATTDGRRGPVSTWPRSTAGSCEEDEMRLNPAKGMMTVAGVLLAALLAGCGAEPAPEPGDAAALAAFASAEEVWRAQRRERLLAPD